MHSNVIEFYPVPDLVARGLWQQVANASDAIAHLVECISNETVSGTATRADLARTAELLTEARALLERTERRETPKPRLADA